MKLDIKEPIIEYDLQKEKPEMVDLSPKEIKEDMEVVVNTSIVVNASVNLSNKIGHGT